MLKLVATSFGLQIITIKYPYVNLEQLDFGFRKKIVTEYNYEYIKMQIMEALKPNTLLYLKDDFGVYYYAFAVPKEKDNSCLEYIFFGPFRYKMNGIVEVEHFIGHVDLIGEELELLKEYFKLVPIVNEMTSLQSLMSNLFSKLYLEKGFAFVAANLKEPVSMFSNPIYPPQNLENDYRKLKIEKKYGIIDLLLKEVCEGNTSKALEHLRFLLKFTDGSNLEKKLEQSKKMAEELNVLLRYKAHQYKVHSLYCEDIYKKFIVQIKMAKIYSVLEEMLHEMVADYTQLIREYSRRQYSNLVRDCMDYIDSHYEEPLTLESEAKRLSVSKSYLSSCFVKETGVNFVSYVNKVRIRYACILLTQLQLPIQRIAELCGFTSSNYFARVFRNIVGRTPSEFRIVMQKKKG